MRWIAIGKGEIHVNLIPAAKATDKPKARFVLRTDKTQRLVLNAPIYPQIAAQLQGDKYVQFIAADLDAQFKPFLLKFSDKHAAQGHIGSNHQSKDDNSVKHKAVQQSVWNHNKHSLNNIAAAHKSKTQLLVENIKRYWYKIVRQKIAMLSSESAQRTVARLVTLPPSIRLDLMRLRNLESDDVGVDGRLEVEWMFVSLCE